MLSLPADQTPLTQTHGVTFQKIRNLSNSSAAGPNIENISADKIMRERESGTAYCHTAVRMEPTSKSREDPKMLQ